MAGNEDNEPDHHPYRRPVDAATLILVDRSGAIPKVLVGKRHDKVVFQPGKIVFPGGRVDPADNRVPVAAPIPAELEANLRRPSTGHSDIEEARRGKPTLVADKIDKESSTSGDDIDLQKEITRSKAYSKPGHGAKKIALVHALNRPLFHIDLTSALQSAIANSSADEHTKGVETDDVKV